MTQWEYKNPRDSDNCICITKADDGIYIEIEDEVARDSYNVTECCSIGLPIEDAVKLRDFLINILG